MPSFITRQKPLVWAVACGIAASSFLAGAGRVAAQLREPLPQPVEVPFLIEARALLAVRPPAKADAGDAAWQRAISTQVILLTDPSIMRAASESDAVQNTKWYKRIKGPDAAGLPAEALGKVVTASALPGTSLIEVRSIGKVEDAAALVNAVAEAAIQRDREAGRMKLQKMIGLLTKEQKSIEIELNEEILKSLRQKEQDLGMDQVGTAIGWSGKQQQLDVLLRSHLGAVVELGTAQEAVARAAAASEKDAKVPADVEAEVANAAPVHELRAELTRIRLSVAELDAPAAGGATGEAARLARREAACRKLLIEAVDDTRAKVLASRAERARIGLADATRRLEQSKEMITHVSGKLADTNKTMIEYHQLRDRQRQLEAKQGSLREEITRINQFSMEEPGELEYVLRAAAAAPAK